MHLMMMDFLNFVDNFFFFFFFLEDRNWSSLRKRDKSIICGEIADDLDILTIFR